jgi:cytochrome c553
MMLPFLRPAAASDPRTNYMLDCMGCHLADGAGAAGKVPDMRAALAPLAASAEGRRYLVAVPGSAQSPLSDQELAQLLNWMVHRLSTLPLPTTLRPFTAAEVATYRGAPLLQPAEVRERLLAAAQRRTAAR